MVSPYWNVTVVEAPFAFTVPFSVAVVVVTLVAASVVTTGGPPSGSGWFHVAVISAGVSARLYIRHSSIRVPEFILLLDEYPPTRKGPVVPVIVTVDWATWFEYTPSLYIKRAFPVYTIWITVGVAGIPLIGVSVNPPPRTSRFPFPATPPVKHRKLDALTSPK
jgi:hypothetical protein